jgi:hypothetical protein
LFPEDYNIARILSSSHSLSIVYFLERQLNMNVTSPFNYTALGGWDFQFKNCSSAALILQYFRAEPTDLDSLALNTPTGKETESTAISLKASGNIYRIHHNSHRPCLKSSGHGLKTKLQVM